MTARARSVLTCGIALCTCNGMEYLEAQLDSLLSQRRPADHLVIFDDASDDGTWEFLQAWTAKVAIPVDLRRNAARQGVIRNFEMAVAALATDLIFLCDQDDIWQPDKMEVIAKVFESSREVLLVHTDARLINSRGEDLGTSLLEALGLTATERELIGRGGAFSVLCRRNTVTGATTAFRRNLLDVALPFPSSALHDEWLGVMAAATGRLVLLDVPTIKYRQHDRNVAGMPVPSTLRSLRRIAALSGNFQQRRARHASALLERLQELPEVRPEVLRLVESALAHARLRSTLPGGLAARIRAVLRELGTGRYRQFSNGLAGAVRDILNR